MLKQIWYGKLIYYFPFNIIYKLQTIIWDYQAAKEYIEKGGNP